MSLYSDINTSKSEHFPKVYDIDAAWQSFVNFIKIKKRQRFFRPTLGNSLAKDLLFELEEEDAIIYAITTLTRELNFWDPRIKLSMNDTKVKLDYENQIVSLEIAFTIQGFENQIIRKSLTL